MGFTTVIDPETGEEKEVWQRAGKGIKESFEEEAAKKQELSDLQQTVTTKEAIVNTGKAIPRMFVNAGVNAVQEGSDTIRDIGAFFGQGEGTSAAEPDKPIIGMGGWRPETLESTGAVEDLGTGILQFGLEWMLLSKALKGANWGLKGLAKAPVVGKYVKPVSTGVTKIQQAGKGLEVGAAKAASKIPVVGKVAAPITAAGVKATVNPKGMIVDFAGFDQYEGRLYDLAANTPAFHWIENNSNPYFRDLLDQLKSDPTDSALEGRLKNAIEGWGIDFGVGGTASIIRLLNGKWAIENLAKEIPGSPGFYKAAEEVNKIEKKIQQDPNIARINRQITQEDRRVFDRTFAHKTKEWRDETWIRTRESLGRPTQRPEFYHGTTESIQNKIRSGGFKESEGLYGSGIYITSNKTAATNWGGGAMRSNIDLEKFVDLGEFPKGDSNAINALYSRARKLRQEGKNILVRNHPRWGDLALVGRDFANIEFTKGRKVKVEGDLDSIRQQIDELGPEPTKPGKGQSRDASGKWTSTYRTWDKWNRRNKSLQARLQELEAEAPTKQVDEVAPEEPLLSDTGEMRVDDQQWYDPEGRPLVEAGAEIEEVHRSAFMRRAQDIADGIETGDLPYFYGVDQAKVDENVAAQVIEGSSISEIIESLKANLPKKTIPIGEAKGVTLSKYRGADKIIKRLKDQVGKQGFTRADRDSVEEFIDLIGHHMFDDVAFSFNNKIDAAGQFSFPRKLVEIRSKIIKTGKFDETAIHELWHSLSRYLPAADVKRYTKEWRGARRKYIKSVEKRMIIEKGNPISPKESLKRNRDLQAKANTELKETGDITKGTQKELVRLANHALAYKELSNFLQNRKFTDANYRFKDVDEYFAEMLTDHFMLNYTPVDFAPEGSFRRIVQEIGIFFKELWIDIHAKLGGPNTEKIFNDYLKGRNNKKLRKYTLESYFAPDQVEGLEDGFRDMGIRINEAAQEFNVIEGAAFDDTFTKTRPDFDDLKGVTDEYNERLKKVESGEIDIDDPSLYRDQDVAAIRKRSKSFSDVSPDEKIYAETTPEVEMLFDVIGKQFDRIVDTGLPKLNTRAMADNLINKFEVEGIPLEALRGDEGFKRIDEFMKTNPEVVRHILLLRIALNVSGEKTAKLARQARNAEVNGTIDFSETMKSLHESLEGTLAFSTQYRRWTRAAGQQLQSTQAFIDTSNIKEVKSKTVPTFGEISIDQPTAIKDLGDSVEVGGSFNNLPEGYRRAVENGEWTPEAQAIAWELTQQAQNVDTLSGIKTIEAFTKGPDPIQRAPKKIDALERVGKGLVTWRTSQLLSGMKTWGAQMSAIPRMMGEPIFNAGIEAASGNGQRAMNYLRQYRFYMRYMAGALKLAEESYKSGVALYDPKVRSGAWIGDVIDDSYQKGRAYQITEKHSSYNLNEQPIFKEIQNSNVGRFLDIAWKAGTLDLRGQQALETFQKSLAGNSLLHTVKFEEGLAMAERQISQGKFGPMIEESTGKIIENIEQAKYAFADQWATAAVKHYTSDAVVNGVTIADAVMNDETALAIGRILTFTNEIRARVPQRTYGFGEQLARERGMTDPVDIEKFATEYREGKVRNPVLKNYNRMMKMGKVASNVFDGKKKTFESWADVPEVGEFTPITTAGWSAIPSFWSSLQRSRLGFIASGIQAFNRSPGDMTKQYMRMTPAFFTVDTFYRDLLHESGAISNRWKGELAIGSIAAGYFFGSVINNDNFPIEFTGYGPTSADMRTMWDQAGRPPLSFRTRWKDDDGNWNYGAWRSYRFMEPGVTFIAGLADYKMLYSELTQEQRDNFGVALTVQLGAQVIQGRFSSSYYSGISDFVDTFSDKGYARRELEEGERSKIARGTHRFFLSFLPRSNHFREMSQAYDQNRRFVYDEGIEPIVIPSAEEWEFVDKSNIQIGKDAYGLDVPYIEQTPGTTNDFESFLNRTSTFGRQFINEMQKITPGFSDELPVRRNWVTGEPLLNPGFLGSDQLPGDDAPWLFRLGVSGLLSIPGNLVSGFGIGTRGPKTKEGYPPSTKRNIVVMEEMLKLSQTGQIFRPPTSNDFNGIELSHEAFKQYKEYISTVTLSKYQVKDPDGTIRPANLAEALHWTITKDPKYKSLGYINRPINPKDGRVGYQKKKILEDIITEYKTKAREEFRTDPNNKYKMEVILREQIRENIKNEDQIFNEGGPHPDQFQSGNMRQNGVNAQQFTAQFNQ